MPAKTFSSPPNTLPRSLTPSLLSFCASISSGKPAFIPSISIKRSVTSFCFDNVARKVRTSGGAVAYGWAIWHLPGLYFEAEHHAVWRNKLDNLIDVSPQLGGHKRLLFLPDETAVYDPFAPRRNIMGQDGDTDAARAIVDLGNRKHAILHRCRIPGTAEIRIYEQDQWELFEINRQLQALMPS